ncbi:3-methyladenine DNA glycosylase [Paraoerskovia marina]|uniref:3-methyladenine DNA glycosylase n=1 Tax=Paraoerskovia marina TaxID=545619 RepID=UPI000492AE69|nr:3-methyladenine DNA glycosylase [Paraoerskovia marina]
MLPSTTAVIPAATWQPAAADHARRADALTATWRASRDRGEKHAIEDFLFSYYPTRVSHLRRWHPGVGRALAGDGTGAAETDLAERSTCRWYARLPDATVALDADAFVAERGGTVHRVRALLVATAGRPGHFGCFGLHEWAMVYKDRAAGRDQRHPLPLRLGHEGTDAVVEQHPVRCSHFDAFRFFTPEARDHNQWRPTRENQPATEQAGCLHAGMDLYKWATKLSPAVPGDLLLDCFELARDIRYLDMRASPYDVSSYGLDAVPIETASGKAEYVRSQREFAERGQALRGRLVEVCDRLPLI